MVHFKIEQYPQLKQELKDIVESYDFGQSDGVIYLDKDDFNIAADEIFERVTEFINENYNIKTNE